MPSSLSILAPLTLRVIALLSLALELFIAAPAQAQEHFLPFLPSASAPPTADAPATSGLDDSHAWFALPPTWTRESPPKPWRLAHLPPRRLARTADGKPHGAADGTIRVLRGAQSRGEPALMAASSTRVFVAFGPEPARGGRPVLTLAARPSGLGDLWRDEPVQGFDVCPDLPARGNLIGLAADDIGPFALIQRISAEPGTPPDALELLRLEGDEWVDSPLPADLDTSAAADLRLLADEQGLWFLVLYNDGSIILSPVSRPAAPAADGQPQAPPLPERTARGARFPRASASVARDPDPVEFFLASGGLYAARRTGDRIHILALSAGEPRPIASVDGVVGRAAVVPLVGVGRVAVIWSSGKDPGPDAAPAAEDRSLRIVEVSLWTGRTLFDGQPVGAGLISAGDIRLLVTVLLGLTAVVLVFVLRTEAGGPELSLPEGIALAEPGRRMLAGAIDLVLALLVSLRVHGLTSGDLASADVWSTSMGLWVVATTLGVGMVVGTLTEGAFGRSPGKFLTRCAVALVVNSELHTPGIRRALVRNIIKWVLPPVAALAFIDPSARHRGETLTRTAVVVALEPEGDNEDPGE